MNTPAILVFRPHQLPAWAEVIDDTDCLIRDWADGAYARRFSAAPGPDEELTLDNCLASLGHDLHALTVLESEGECRRYVGEPDYCWRHNKGIGFVIPLARRLGWMEDEGYDD